jgi:hypothetical protein
MIEEAHESRVLWQQPRLMARVFEGSSGQWGVQTGAMVWYATEKRRSNFELDVAMSIDTGETRPSYEEIVEWLEVKARRAVKDAFGLDEKKSNSLVIKSEVEIVAENCP